MDREGASGAPDEASDAERDAADVDGNQASGVAREPGQVDEAPDPDGGPVDATLRGEPGTPHAMGLGNEPAPETE